jgi:hypothetical protein
MHNKEQEIIESFKQQLLHPARMICGSKTNYLTNNPQNKVFFNANIIAVGENLNRKIWHGDLDLTLDAQKLKLIAAKNETALYVLRESDARLGSENEYIENLKRKAVWSSND